MILVFLLLQLAAAPTPIPLPRVLPCSATGGFGQTFGTPSSARATDDSQIRKVDDPNGIYQPFQEITVVLTKDDRVDVVSSVAYFVDATQADSFVERLVAMYKKSLAVTYEQTASGPQGYERALFTGPKREGSDPESIQPIKGMVISISRYESGVELVCWNMDFPGEPRFGENRVGSR